MSDKKLNLDEVKAEAMEGFKLWLDQIGLGSENFKEEHYELVLLMSFYETYQYQVEQFMKQQMEAEKKGSKLFVPEDTANKNSGKILRPDFGKK